MTTASEVARTIRDGVVARLAESWGIEARRSGRKVIAAGAEFFIYYDYWTCNVGGRPAPIQYPPSARLDCPETLAAVFVSHLKGMGLIGR